MLRKIFKTGHSVAITLSSKVLGSLGLKLGDTVKIELNKEKSAVVIRPGSKENQLSLNLTSRPKLGSAIRKG